MNGLKKAGLAAAIVLAGAALGAGAHALAEGGTSLTRGEAVEARSGEDWTTIASHHGQRRIGVDRSDQIGCVLTIHFDRAQGAKTRTFGAIWPDGGKTVLQARWLESAELWIVHYLEDEYRTFVAKMVQHQSVTLEMDADRGAEWNLPLQYRGIYDPMTATDCFPRDRPPEA